MFVTYTLIVDIWLLGDDRNLWTIKMFRSFEISTVIFSLQYLFPAASVTNLAAISLEEIQASPHQKEDIWSSCSGCLVYTAMSSAIVFSPFFLGRSDITTFFHVLASYFSLRLCCLFIVVVSYSSIAIKLYCGTHPQRAISRERKLTKTLFIVTIVSLILVLPFTILEICVYLSLGEIFETISYPTCLHLIYSLACLFYANSVINPLIYALKMPEFKRALLLLLRCRSRPEPFKVFLLMT